ncbi:MAG: UvrD-helicase domain-containing protein, partial [Gammaproteobacteria bacterium]
MSRRSRDILSGLNPQQRAAVTHIDGPLLVLAGAGSGKTRVITRKIGYLIGECGIAAHNIAAVTFTNKAAREMKSRVSELVKGERARGLTVSTFHTLGLRILQVEHKRVGYKRGFSIFDADDSRNLVRDILKAESRDLAGIVDQVQSRISSFKSDLISPDVAIAMAEDEEGMRAARAYAEYERFLRAYNAMDFDDLIARPVHLFEQDREALEVWQNRLRYLLVDECQDTNGA